MKSRAFVTTNILWQLVALEDFHKLYLIYFKLMLMRTSTYYEELANIVNAKKQPKAKTKTAKCEPN
jgi:hypothetical protein